MGFCHFRRRDAAACFTERVYFHHRLFVYIHLTLKYKTLAFFGIKSSLWRYYKSAAICIKSELVNIRAIRQIVPLLHTTPTPSTSNMKISTSTMKKGILRNVDEGCSERTVSTGTSTSSVSFHNITVRGYDRTIGDNPSCSSGCPIR